MNPPPSPVTERSRSIIGAERRPKSGGVRAAVKARLYKPRRKHRHKMQRMSSVASPSCSTDMCEDSEPYLAAAENLGRDTGYSSYFMNLDRYTYECDPLCPPPPTPYLSEEPSCPPSPRSTECSFFISYPPPPPSSDYSDWWYYCLATYECNNRIYCIDCCAGLLQNWDCYVHLLNNVMLPSFI